MRKRNRGAVAALFAALGALGGCGETPIECDAQGFIVIPDDASHERWRELFNRNLDLNRRRIEKLSGDGKSLWYTPESLARAEGCP